LTKFRPRFGQYRSIIVSWAVIWPLLILKDLTVDLVRNIIDHMGGIFQRDADKAFS
jgi:hypothetical protein